MLQKVTSEDLKRFANIAGKATGPEEIRKKFLLEQPELFMGIFHVICSLIKDPIEQYNAVFIAACVYGTLSEAQESRKNEDKGFLWN